MIFNRPAEFRDRQAAGMQLAKALQHLAPDNPLVLALPRGGVPVAAEVARALDADLDLLFVRKLGAPGHAELGIGAIVDGANPQIILNEDLVRQLAPGAAYIDAEVRRQLAEIDRRRQRYMGERLPTPIANRVVIVVDDGIATGGTVKAALAALHRSGASRIVLAVPVAPADSIAALRNDCDEIVCLAQPAPFYAVGAHYANFDQTTDDEVVRLLENARAI
jgi:putative phosphoribosyl transferase